MPFPTLHELSEALAWMLLHFLWQGFLVGALYAIGKRLSDSVRWQHGLALTALLLLLVLPAITFYALSLISATPVETAAITGGVQSTIQATLPAAGTTDAALAMETSWWSQLLVAIWLLGALVISVRLLGDWRLVRLAIREGAEPPKELEAMLRRQMQRMGLSRHVRLKLTARITTPAVYGLMRPVVLLPIALALSIPKDQLEALLAHELAHIRRADFIANLLTLCARTLLYFHPVVHWICRDLERTREVLCDDLVVDLDIDPLKYARALSKAEEFRQQVPVPLLTATGGELTARVHRILAIDPDKRRKRNDRAPLLLAIAAITASLAGLSGITQEQLLAVTRPEFRAVYGALIAAQQPPAIAKPTPEFEAPSAEALRFQLPAAPDVIVESVAPDDSSRTVEDEVLAPRILPPELITPIDTGELSVADIGIRPQPLDVPQTYDAAAMPTSAEQDRNPIAAEMTTSPAQVDAMPVSPERLLPSPTVLHRVEPRYPRSARWQGIEGSITLSYRIDSRGRPVDIAVVSAAPSGVFDKATIAAFNKWRFEPGSESDARYSQIFDFNLGNEDTGRCEMRLGSKICRRPSELSAQNETAAASRTWDITGNGRLALRHENVPTLIDSPTSLSAQLLLNRR